LGPGSVSSWTNLPGSFLIDSCLSFDSDSAAN